MAISSDTFLVVQETYCFYKKKNKKMNISKDLHGSFIKIEKKRLTNGYSKVDDSCTPYVKVLLEECIEDGIRKYVNLQNRH